MSDNAVAYMARQVGVERTDIAFSDWSGRTIEYHRARIRRALGFRECSIADADALTWWSITSPRPSGVRNECVSISWPSADDGS
ncbi:DUF4158 domain-containing protein [Nocardia farcinica]|uniref:DUF4158 domain-containing protein n=1 Tax=Nocardia farcinica TaxID=37329 RepID=UPI0034D79FAE